MKLSIRVSMAIAALTLAGCSSISPYRNAGQPVPVKITETGGHRIWKAKAYSKGREIAIRGNLMTVPTTQFTRSRLYTGHLHVTVTDESSNVVHNSTRTLFREQMIFEQIVQVTPRSNLTVNLIYHAKKDA